MIVQIYEIQNPQEAEQCIALGVDHIGSILFSEDEWCNPSLRDVILVSAGTDVKNSLLPLFQDFDTLARSLDYYCPHFIHLCDSITDHRRRPRDLEQAIQLQCNLKEKFPEIGIIRSIPIPGEATAQGFPTLDLAQALESVSDLFLIDTWLETEPVEGFIGITGKTADRVLSRKLIVQSGIPVILAGGLSPENVFDILLQVRPYGADTCTYTNKVDPGGKAIRFQKDFTKVGKFVTEVRRAERAIRKREI